MLTVDILTSPSAEQLGAIARLYEETGWWVDADAHRDSVRRLIAGSYCFFIASEAGQLVGMGRAISDGVSDAYLQDIAVTAERRSEGIATRIVTAIVNHLEENGIDWIGLIAEGSAHGVYTRCGFIPMADTTPMRYQER
jgi:spermidine synthase